MRKGVSPVVATVLLIAIAVISAVAVWYWVAPLTGAQPTGSSTQYSFVPSPYRNSTSDGCWSLDIANAGGVAIPANTILAVRVQSTGAATSLKVNISTAVQPGATTNFNITVGTNATNRSSSGLGAYVLTAMTGYGGTVSGFTETYFTC